MMPNLMPQGGDVMSDAREGPILVDIADDRPFESTFLEKIGHPVLVCHGPGEGSLCPLLAGDGCDKFDEAHGIVFQLDLDRPQHRAIVEKYRDLAGDDLPIKVVVQPEQVEKYRDLLADVEVWTRRPTAGDLDGFASEVEAADRFA
jgi:hypothetical protein